MPVQVVIPSKGRAHRIRQESLALVPDALVTVDEVEMDDYLKVVPREQLLPHPGRSELPSLGAIRNWILDNVKSDVIVQFDDDVTAFRCHVGWRSRTYTDPATIAELLHSTAICARDAGCKVFGFSHLANPTFFQPYKPFRLNSWVGVVLGLIDGHGLRFDVGTTYDDVDLSLQSLMRHRIVWCDLRWCYLNHSAGGKDVGGLTGTRTQDDYAKNHVRLRQRWGNYVGAVENVGTSLNVPRTQQVNTPHGRAG